jgi:ribonuclease Z
MIKVTFLGTGGSTPTKFRGLPSTALEHDGKLFLFDCGEGTQRQCIYYSVNISKIKAIFLSHIHGDHTIGIAGLMRTLALNKRTEPLEIYIPKGYEKQLSELMGFDRALIGYKILIKPIESGVIYKGRDFEICAFKLNHTISTYGFAFKEKDGLNFIKSKVNGVKGEMFKVLLTKKSIKVGNRTIRLKDVTIVKPGRKVVYATDTRPANTTLIAAKNADLLIHESTYGAAEKDLAKQRGHSTTLEAAAIAKKAKAKRLVLMHLSARYRSTEQLLKETKAVFNNTEIAKDGFVVNI